MSIDFRWALAPVGRANFRETESSRNIVIEGVALDMKASASADGGGAGTVKQPIPRTGTMAGTGSSVGEYGGVGSAFVDM